MSARVAVVEDHLLIRDSLVNELRRFGHEVVAVGDTLDAVPASGVDLLLLDLDLADGMADVDRVAALVSDGVAVLVVSALTSPRHARRMVAAGVCGVVAKSDRLDDLGEAVEAALAGRAWMSPALARVMMADEAAIRPQLSVQELRALRLYACGLKLDSVARAMGVAPSTAKQYVDRVRQKYEQVGTPARTKSELYRIGVADGYIDSGADPA